MTESRRRKTKSVRRKVQRVIDGDSFTVRKRVRGSQHIRVAGLNAPERGQRGYSTAKRKLSRLKGKRVTLRPRARSYGRTVATVTYRRKKLGAKPARRRTVRSPARRRTVRSPVRRIIRRRRRR